MVSVAICAYNAGADLRASVDSALAQTYPSLEVLVIDDGSTDDSIDALESIQDPRLRILRQPNAGKSSALNRAIQECRGAYLMIQDADDLSHATRAARQVAAFESDPELAICFCGHELLMDGRALAPRTQSKSRDDCAHDIEAMRMPGHDPTAMYRVSLVRDFEYDPELKIAQGFDFILRVGEKHPICVLGSCLYSYRIDTKSITRRNPSQRMRFVRQVIEKTCRRRGLDPVERLAELPDPERTYFTPRERDNNLAAHFMESALDLRRQGRWLDAIRAGFACAGLQPLDPHYHKAWVFALSPEPLLRRMRSHE